MNHVRASSRKSKIPPVCDRAFDAMDAVKEKDKSSSSALKELQQKYKDLKKEKDDMEHDFGVKRARFKHIYLECEAASKKEKEARQKTEAEIALLKEKNESLQAENEGIRTAARLSEESSIEEISRLKVKHQEELASMEHIWQEATRDIRTTLGQQFEEERSRLIQENQKLVEQLKGKTEEKSEGLMSMVSQAIKRSTSSSQITSVKETKQDGESLESSMQKTEQSLTFDLLCRFRLLLEEAKAQQNAETLRSIVMPLEEEIASLKSKLKEANTKIKQYEIKVTDGSSAADENGLNKASADVLQDKVKELQGYLEAERSSRTDLEMFVAVLNTQKGVLQEDADKLRQELHNVCRLLEQEKMEHRELKQTWKMANDQFLEQQTMLSWEIEKMKRFLTPVQLEKLSKEVRQKKALTIKTVAEEPYMVGKPEDDLIKFDIDPSKSERVQTASDIRLVEKDSPDKSFSLSVTPDDSDDDSEEHPKSPTSHHVGSLEEGEELQEDENGLPRLRRASSSSDIDKAILKKVNPSIKAHSQGDISAATSGSPEDAWAIISSPTVAELEKKMHLNETGWSTMKDSSVVTPGLTCMMCQNYEKQLQRLQTECVQVKNRNDVLHMTLKAEKEQLAIEKEKVETLEKSVYTASEDAQRQISSYNENQDYLDQQLAELVKEFERAKEDMANQVKKLAEDRDMMTAELQRLREENESLQAINQSLVGSESAGTEEKKEALDDNRIQMLEKEVLKLQELSNSKEEELRGQIVFLNDRVMAEQFNKENMEKILQTDLDNAREEIKRLKEELAIRDTGRRKEDVQEED